MIPHNPDVVNDLLSRYTFHNLGDIQTAFTDMAGGLELSMQHTKTYQIPLDQKMPEEIARGQSAAFVHPFNLATALAAVGLGAAQFGGAPIAAPANLQLYNAGQWSTMGANQFALIALPAPPAPPAAAEPPPPPPPPPAPPPAPAPVVVPPAPAATPANPVPDLSSLVSAAMNASAAAPVGVPTSISTAEEFNAWRASQGHAPAMTTTPAPSEVAAYVQQPAAPAGPPIAPSSVPATPVPPSAAPAAAAAPAPPPPARVVEGELVDGGGHLGMPDASLLAGRVSSTGRPQKSPFERKVEERKKVAPPPFWWEFMRTSATKVFTSNPATALDDSSTGSGPLQTYALLVELLSTALRGVHGAITVAELRTFIAEVQTGIDALESADAINQLVRELFDAEPAAE